MRSLFRSSTLALAALFCGSAFAQPLPPYTVSISGTVLGCNSGNSYVNITTMTGTLPEVDIDVPLDPNCGWTVALTMDSYSGAFVVTAPCAGALITSVGQYEVDFFSTASISMTLECGNNPPPCDACMSSWPATTGGGPNGGGDPIPWTVAVANCSTGGTTPYAYVWDFGDGSTSSLGDPGTHVYTAAGEYGVCLYITDASGCTSADCDTVVVLEDGTINPPVIQTCEAGFFAMQAYEWVDTPGTPNGGGGSPIPNELWIWNLSNGGTGNFTYVWNFGDGTSSTEEFPTHTYASGEYELCLTINDGAGCTDTYCDMISVDGDGILNGLMGESGSRNAFTIRVMNELSTNVGEERVYTDLGTWPNPVTNELNLTLNSALKGAVRMTITDMSGRMVMDEQRTMNNGVNTLVVPVAELKAGLYMVRIGNGKSTVSNRFVKVR